MTNSASSFHRFSILTLTPLEFGKPGLAIATVRAGGVGLLDAQYLRPDDLPCAVDAVRRLLAATSEEHRIGLRLAAGQIGQLRELIDTLRPRPSCFLLCDWQTENLEAGVEELVGSAPAAAEQQLSVLVEVTDPRHANGLPAGLACAGLVVKGRESGGWVGGDSSFILAQKLLAHESVAEGALPIFVQGGIGLHSAAACRAAGCAGVVLDDQLALMPESPLPAALRFHLEGLDGSEALVVEDETGACCRVLQRPGFDAAAAFACEAESAGPGTLRAAADGVLGWGRPEARAWPVGQMVGTAARYRDRYRTTGRLIQAFSDSYRSACLAMLEHPPLAPYSPLAEAHGTRYPVVQGPMTRVSDNPDFAAAVAEAGGLPLLALALMKRDESTRLLEATRVRLGERPWGVGILGFVPPDLRRQQIAALRDVRPPFALIAGGRPDQADELEELGISTYLHVPVPALLEAYLEQGARKFVFEGRECGGHVGPLSSFTLWDAAVSTLLERIPAEQAVQVHALFAGGIHDSRSAAMVAAIAAPLAARGTRVGVLMGTAYLFTHEAVACGAIGEEFQRQAVQCERTISLKTGPGHAIRCAESPFTQTFQAARRHQDQERLEGLLRGRLRLAAKGLERGNDGALDPADESRQRSEGMYMLGQLATLRRQPCSMADLHREVSEGGRDTQEADAAANSRLDGTAAAAGEPIAIIGIGTLLPGAHDPETYWANLLAKVGALREIPADRFDWRLLYDQDPDARDRSYSRWGGFLDDVVFDPLRYGIPPKSIPSICAAQLLTLEAVRRALDDAGLGDGDFDRENTSVILGNGDGGGLLGNLFVARTLLPFLTGEVSEEVRARMPEWTEESFPGTLNSVTAGRVANRFDLGGANYTVDAACASSLTAVDLGVRELRLGTSNLAITGGVDTGQSPFGFVAFSKTQALSSEGRIRTFDRDADGIAISEGVAIVVLKRLEDAERDGDRVYAVIRGVAGSSDGKAMGLTAPRPLGQRRALERAYRQAAIDPRTIGLYEAHGTGTSVGDQAELETLVGVLRDDGAATRSCAIGSAKTLIGHTKTAAGVAGLIKAALALHHRVLPPHAGVDDPLLPIREETSPVYLLNEARPWLSGDHPRRCGVSAFGFGGTNSHAVLEEHLGAAVAGAAGGDRWPWELVVLRADSREALATEIRRLLGALEAGGRPRLRDLAFTYALRARERRGCAASLSMVTSDLMHLRDAMEIALAKLVGFEQEKLPPGVVLGECSADAGRRLAFLFPGQGSQRPGMMQEIALYVPEVRAALECADRELAADLGGPLSRFVYPPAAFGDGEREEQRRRLAATDVAQAAIGVLSAGYLDFTRRLGLRPAMVAGHSFGEFTALHAAGVLSRRQFLLFSARRGRAMAAACAASDGAMAAVEAPAATIEPHLEDSEVVIANLNAPEQTVVSGPRAAVAEILERLAKAGVHGQPLPVAGAFHSPLMASAETEVAEAVAELALESPALPIYSNVTARAMPPDPGDIRRRLTEHLLRPVIFSQQIARMADDGAQLFLEVGPGRALTGLARRTLEGRPGSPLAVSLGGSDRDLRGLLLSLGKLVAHGVDLDLPALHEGRRVRRLDLARLAETTRESEPSSAAVLVNGASARPRDSELSQPGAAPFLTSETAPDPRFEPMPGSNPGHHGGDDVLNAYRSYQATMREFLALQERTMARFLGGAVPLGEGESTVAAAAINELAPRSTGSVPPTPSPAAEMEPATGPETAETWDREGLATTLLELVSDRTGYPADMLGMDLDVEAELGIDSIKRVEILHSLFRQLPEDVGNGLRRRMDSLIRLRSLDALVGAVLQHLAEAETESRAPDRHPDPVLPPESSPESLPGPSSADGCPRYRMVGRPQVMPAAASEQLDGLYLVTGDGALARGVAEALTELGARPARLDADLLGRPDDLQRRYAELRQQRGPVRGLVHLAPVETLGPTVLGHGSGDSLTLERWRAMTQVAVKSLGRLLHLAADDFAADGAEATVLVASRLDGRFGRADAGPTRLPADGGCAGFLHTLETEFPGVRAKAVDLDPALDTGEQRRLLLAELLAPAGGFLEIGYPEGVRTVFESVAAATDGESAVAVRPAAEWVVLATGGARGITADVVRSLVREGMRLVVVGRSPEPPAEDPTTASHQGRDELRAALLGAMQRQESRPTPAEIERQVDEILAQRAMRDNLEGFRRAGAEVEYHSVDVREPAFGTLIDSIYERHGRLDAVIHGAGVLEDRLIRDKTSASFARVFDTKVDSTFLLSRHLRPESLSLFVLFGSVAGRFGNRGQSDYAAANDLLNRMAWSLSRRWTATRVVVFNWGPWQGSGMATEELNRRFRARGVEPIATSAGCRFVLEELARGGRDEVEVIAGNGPWATQAESERERDHIAA